MLVPGTNKKGCLPSNKKEMSKEINDNSIILKYNVPYAMIDGNVKRVRSPAGNGPRKYSSVSY